MTVFFAGYAVVTKKLSKVFQVFVHDFVSFWLHT